VCCIIETTELSPSSPFAILRYLPNTLIPDPNLLKERKLIVLPIDEKLQIERLLPRRAKLRTDNELAKMFSLIIESLNTLPILV
jgi:hypothetical protein